MKKTKNRLLILFGILCLLCLVLGFWGYGYVTLFRFGGVPIYSSIQDYVFEVEERGERVFLDYQDGRMAAFIRNIGSENEPYLDIQILEKRLFWWALSHFESAISPISPVNIGGTGYVVGCYTGWNEHEASSVQLQNDNGQTLSPIKQAVFNINDASYLGYVFKLEHVDKQDGLYMFQYLDINGFNIPELSYKGLYRAEIRMQNIYTGKSLDITDEQQKTQLLTEVANLMTKIIPSRHDAGEGSSSLVFRVPQMAVAPGPSYTWVENSNTSVTVYRNDDNMLFIELRSSNNGMVSYYESDGAQSPLVLQLLSDCT